ncbi:dual specificity protein phosphatase 23-like [Lycorma delicatula]|uniref:dual specificity protein phosphatase 23-like n=1 Tax=Lycorma delicatula TaxID=130591 RepID=UPI003F50F5D5
MSEIVLNQDVDDGDVYPPWNFSWIEHGKLAAMACPQKGANLKFLVEQGISHLVTLSYEKRPPYHLCNQLKYTDIFIKEFEAPTIKQIIAFIDICQRCCITNEAVGVHCRMGRGRAGVMAACYLVRFKDYTPERAITTIRITRPGSIETYDQEKIVHNYFDCVRGTITK